MDTNFCSCVGEISPVCEQSICVCISLSHDTSVTRVRFFLSSNWLLLHGGRQLINAEKFLIAVDCLLSVSVSVSINFVCPSLNGFQLEENIIIIIMIIEIEIEMVISQ